MSTQSALGKVNLPPIDLKTIQTELDSLILKKINTPEIPTVPDMPEIPTKAVGINTPKKVENVTEPTNPALAPAAASTKIIENITGINLPALTDKHASTPPSSLVELGTSENITDVELDSEEAEESIQPDAPVELEALEDVTEVDPLEQPEKLEEAPIVNAPGIPELVAPETVDPIKTPIKRPIELAAPTKPTVLEAPLAVNLAKAPVALIDPKKKEEAKGAIVLTTTTFDAVSDPSTKSLPNTRSERRLPNTGTESSLMGQGMGAFMAGAAGSLLFWKRRKGKQSK